MLDPEKYLEQTLNQLTDLQAQVPDLRKKYEDAAQETRSKDRRVSASVAPTGEVRSLSFHGESYRKMPAKELAELVLRTINQAREQAVTDAREQIFQSLDPQVQALLGGSGATSEDWSVDTMLKRFLGNVGDTPSSDTMKESGQ